MTTMKRFGLPALFAIGVALFTSSSARAEDWGTITLGNTGVQPGASGQATLANVTFLGGYWYQDPLSYDLFWVERYSGDLSMTCQRLKPNTGYDTSVGYFKTGRDGTLQGVMRTEFSFAWGDYRSQTSFGVGVQLAKGSRATVLEGYYSIYDPHAR